MEGCIREGILADFLLREKAKVISMSIFEFDQELHDKTIRQEEFEDGYSRGAEKTLLSLITRKLRKGKSPETIAEELDEDISVILPICDVAKDFAPEYDVQEIYEALHAKH